MGGTRGGRGEILSRGERSGLSPPGSNKDIFEEKNVERNGYQDSKLRLDWLREKNGEGKSASGLVPTEGFDREGKP